MNRPIWARAVLVSVALLMSGACRPSLSPPNEVVPVEPPPNDTWATTGDTAPPLPCATPEVEPNDVGTEATVLPLERPGCGELTENDRDAFAFTVDDAGWLSVEAERSDGSLADLVLRLDGPDGQVITKDNDLEDTDVSLEFPAPAGAWVAVVTETEGRGGERFTYELLVSEAKAPVEWTRLEDEPNDGSGDAEALTGTESVFGTFDGNDVLADRDWYEIRIPGGEHELSIDVDAFRYGAASDVEVQIWDADNARIDTLTEDVDNGVRDPDPRGVYRSPGDETIRLQVVEEDSIEGPAHWYVLHLRLEAR